MEGDPAANADANCCDFGFAAPCDYPDASTTGASLAFYIAARQRLDYPFLKHVYIFAQVFPDFAFGKVYHYISHKLTWTMVGIASAAANLKNWKAPVIKNI